MAEMKPPGGFISAITEQCQWKITLFFDIDVLPVLRGNEIVECAANVCGILRSSKIENECVARSGTGQVLVNRAEVVLLRLRPSHAFQQCLDGVRGGLNLLGKLAITRVRGNLLERPN